VRRDVEAAVKRYEIIARSAEAMGEHDHRSVAAAFAIDTAGDARGERADPFDAHRVPAVYSVQYGASMRRAALAFALALAALAKDAEAAPIAWVSWSDDAFARAERENRFVLLYLEAVWCHWCHVMDHETYGDERVQKLIESRFVAVRVDSDARPDLALRYKRYGWPATVIFGSGGVELAKRRGYIEPDEMVSLLEGILAHPVPEPEKANRSKDQGGAAASRLSEAVKAHLLAAHQNAQDTKLGGLKSVQKLLDPDSVEYGIARGLAGDAVEEKTARRTVAASLALVDPAWGGIYQYSTHGDWKQPHFEKIMSAQAGAMRIYSLAYSAWKDARALAAAKAIRGYVRAFLRDPGGAFFTSQDADLLPGEHADKYFALSDRARRKKGLPRVDRHIYARENGWMIEALAIYGTAAKDQAAIDDAIDAARAIAKTRSLEDGGFRHDAEDAAGPYLGDTLAMGRAFLALYEATQDRDDLVLAERAADFIGRRFAGDDAGFPSAANVPGARVGATRDLAENIEAARFFNRLARYSGRAADRALAERSVHYLAVPSVTEAAFTEPGVLLADAELGSEPLHVTVVGSKRDSGARALFDAALRIASTYRRIEWWDPAEGPLPNADVAYPALKKPAAFVCSGTACSTPIFDAKEMAKSVKALAR
jgi:uncharacterized protein YyaL (SSP411 family)